MAAGLVSASGPSRGCPGAGGRGFGRLTHEKKLHRSISYRSLRVSNRKISCEPPMDKASADIGAGFLGFGQHPMPDAASGTGPAIRAGVGRLTTVCRSSDPSRWGVWLGGVILRALWLPGNVALQDEAEIGWSCMFF
jgi:hypothetical protein